MDNASATLTNMVVDNVNFTSVKEPSMAEMPNILPDPVLESAKALLDSLSMSTTNLAKMLKPVPSPVKKGTSGATVDTGAMPKRCAIKQEKRSGLKITNHGLNKWRPAVMPRTQTSDMNMRTTIESNQITLTLEPVEADDSFAFRNVPYYARGRNAAGFKAQNVQPKVEDASALDQSKIFERWHRKHINKILRYANRGSVTKPITYNSNSKLRHGWRPYQPPSLHRANSNAPGSGQKRKYCDVSNRYYQYLNKPKRARHDAFQIIFRSHILIDEVARTVSADDNTLYPRKFVTWPSGKLVMPGYYPNKTGGHYKRKPYLMKKRTWSMYRVPRPKPHPVYRVPQNRYAPPSSLRKLWNKKLSSENRLRWDPATKKFTLTPVYQRPVKPAPKQWFRFTSNSAPKNAITNALNMSRASSIAANMHRNYSTPAPKTQYNWHRPVSYKPPQTYKPSLSYKRPPACNPSPPSQSVLPPSVQYVLRDLRVILHCSGVPGPSFFNSYRNYATNCVLFQVRRLMAVKLLRQGRYEKRIAQIKQNVDSGSTEGPVDVKPVLSNKMVTSSVYISDLTEKALSEWTSDLPKACGVGVVSNHSLRGEVLSLSSDWLHVCKNRVVESIPFHPSEGDEPVRVKNVFLAWAFDEPPNDTVSASRIIDTGKPSTTKGSKQRDLQVGEFADSNYLPTDGIKSAASNPHLTQSQAHIHHRGAISLGKGSRSFPKLSFCVRFRCSLCTRDCTCRFDPISNARSDDLDTAMVELPSIDERRLRVVDGEVTVSNGAIDNYDIMETNRDEPVFAFSQTDISDTLVGGTIDTDPVKISLNPAESTAESTMQSQESDPDGSRNSVSRSPNRILAGILSPVKSDCIFRTGKRLMSDLSKHVNVVCRGVVVNVPNTAASAAFHCDTVNTAVSQTAAYNVSAGGHCSSVIGRHCLGSRQANNRTVELGRTQSTERDSSNNASLEHDSVADSVEGMGNNFVRQKLLCGVTSILQVSGCSESHPFILGTGIGSVNGRVGTKGGIVCPVNGKSHESQTQSDEPADREVARESHGINGGGSACESCRYYSGDAAIEEIPSTCLRSYASSPGADNDKVTAVAESATAVDSIARSSNVESAQNGCDGTMTVGGKSPLSVAKSRQATKPGRVSLTNNKADTASAEGKISDTVKTRSSHRLRSRLKRNKRGRYETDYISDFPKAAKKARKIQPTNDYDNGDFWKFYHSCENTVYAQNLLLQYKYVKLFKSKGVTAECAPSVVGIWDTTTYDSSNKKRPVVPDDGKLAVLDKYAKQRKTPDLQQTDDQCAYCGRSFEGTDKAARDEHLSRHGARYKALAVPRLPKKKKMKPIQKAGKPTHLPPYANNESHQQVVENRQNAQDLRLLARPSSLSMGHRKQTARKSFTIKSTLPKNVLIKTLECEMRSPAIPGNGKSGESISDRIKSEQHAADPFQGVGSILNGCSPLAAGGRRTITGMPVTYNHLQRNYL